MEDATYNSRRKRWWRIVVAAVAVVLVIVGARAAVRAGRGDTGMTEASTGIGQRRTVRLEDGTRVELSVSSSLRYPAAFSATNRLVTLVGEAFFVVAKDSARPFVVMAGPVAAQSLGARFGVRAYAGQNTAQVVADSGRVRLRPTVSATPQATVLEGGSLARVARDGAVTRRDGVDPVAYLQWRKGRISLDNVPLRAALVELARWQKVDFRIGDSVVANRRVTGTFASHQTLTEILDGIALQLGARYEHQGNTVTFWLER